VKLEKSRFPAVIDKNARSDGAKATVPEGLEFYALEQAEVHRRLSSSLGSATVCFPLPICRAER
jgi:hypothetical protein